MVLFQSCSVHAEIGNLIAMVTVRNNFINLLVKIAFMKQDYNADRCTNMANYKLMRELMLLLAMDNAAIIEMKGFCLRGETIDPRLNMKGVVIVTEGSRQVPEAFYNHCWPCRLQVSYCRANQGWQWHNILFTIVK